MHVSFDCLLLTVPSVFSNVHKFHNECRKSLKIPKGNQNLYIEEEQTAQWSKEKVQNSSAPEEWAVPAPLVTPVVLI
jgi:hypothetical protein